MNKMQMAHEYALEMLKETIPTGSLHGSEARSVAESIVKSAFALADMMQAEAKEREDKTRPGVLTEEWQPDWSQAPGKMNWFSIDKDGTAAWHMNKPMISAKEWVIDCGDCGGDCYMYTSNFGYTGNWQDSLRERPQ